jgi:hypothetical protein
MEAILLKNFRYGWKLMTLYFMHFPLIYLLPITSKSVLVGFCYSIFSFMCMLCRALFVLSTFSKVKHKIDPSVVTLSWPSKAWVNVKDIVGIAFTFNRTNYIYVKMLVKHLPITSKSVLVGFCYSIFSFMCMLCRALFVLYFCTFSVGHCVVCSSIYGFWLSLWHFQAFLTLKKI